MWMIDMEEFLTLRDLFNEELSISEIARQTGHSRVTVRKYLNSQVPPLPQKRSKKPSKLDGHREYIIDRLKEFPLSASRIYREIQDRGFTGKYTIVKDFVREVRPEIGVPAIYRYETKPGVQAQVDWAETLLFHHGSRLFANEICRIYSANRRLYPYPVPHKCVWVFWRLSPRASI
jgi:transposase